MKHTSGTKARNIFNELTARVKPCPSHNDFMGLRLVTGLAVASPRLAPKGRARTWGTALPKPFMRPVDD